MKNLRDVVAFNIGTSIFTRMNWSVEWLRFHINIRVRFLDKKIANLEMCAGREHTRITV